MPDVSAYHLGFETGFKNQRQKIDAKTACPFPQETIAAENWLRGYRQGAKVKVGRGKQNASPWCQHPADCRATGDKLCNSCNMKRLHADPEFAKRRDQHIKDAHAKQVSAPGYLENARAAMSARATKMWEDKNNRKRQARLLRAQWKDPEFRAAQIARVTKNHEDPARKEMHRQIMKKVAADPKARKKMYRTRYANGEWMPKRAREAIADEVRTTKDTLEVIGLRWGIGRRRVGNIAREYGVPKRKRGGRRKVKIILA